MSNPVKQDIAEQLSSTPSSYAAANNPRVPPYKFLDSWRGLAAIWVALFHAAEVMILGFHANRHALIYVIASQGQLGVQLFFVISGYCIVNAADGIIRKNQSVKDYAKARARRIYPTYWAALVITALLSIGAEWFVKAGIFHSSVLGSSDVMSQPPLWFFSNITLTSLAFGHALMVMQAWTLCYEVAFYLILGIFLAVAVRRKSSNTLCYSSHLLTAMCLLWLLAAPYRIPYPLDLWPQFGFGVILYHLVKDPKDKKVKMVAIITIVITLILAVLRHNQVGHVGQTISSQFPFALIFAVLLYVAHPYDSRISSIKPLKALSFVGLFSYSLYLTHTFSIGLVSQGIKLLNLPTSYDILYYIMMIGGALLFGYGFFKIFEEPFLNSNSHNNVIKP